MKHYILIGGLSLFALQSTIAASSAKISAYKAAKAEGLNLNDPLTKRRMEVAADFHLNAGQQRIIMGYTPTALQAGDTARARDAARRGITAEALRAERAAEAARKAEEEAAEAARREAETAAAAARKPVVRVDASTDAAMDATVPPTRDTASTAAPLTCDAATSPMGAFGMPISGHVIGVPFTSPVGDGAMEGAGVMPVPTAPSGDDMVAFASATLIGELSRSVSVGGTNMHPAPSAPLVEERSFVNLDPSTADTPVGSLGGEGARSMLMPGLAPVNTNHAPGGPLTSPLPRSFVRTAIPSTPGDPQPIAPTPVARDLPTNVTPTPVTAGGQLPSRLLPAALTPIDEGRAV